MGNPCRVAGGGDYNALAGTTSEEQVMARKKPEKEESGALTFEEALEKLEAVVARLESGEVPLDESMKLYEEGVKAFRRCQQLLGEAETKIQQLVRDLGSEVRLEEVALDAGSKRPEDEAPL